MPFSALFHKPLNPSWLTGTMVSFSGTYPTTLNPGLPSLLFEARFVLFIFQEKLIFCSQFLAVVAPNLKGYILDIFNDNSGNNRFTNPELTFCCKRLLAFMLKGVPLNVLENEMLELKSWFNVFLKSACGLF